MPSNSEEYMQKWYSEHPDYMKKYNDVYKKSAHGKKVMSRNIANWFRKKRIQLIFLMGPQCSCMGVNCWHTSQCNVNDIRVLQIDHIKGDGSVKRRLFKTNHNEYSYYLKNTAMIKNEIQVLCANCNWAKRERNQEQNKYFIKPD